MIPPRGREAPSGPPIGARLPRRLREEIRRLAPASSAADGTLVAFVTENCVGCQQLLGSVANARLDGGLVLVAKTPSPEFRQALSELTVPTVLDVDGSLWRAAGITATPLVVKVDGQGRVNMKEVTHRVAIAEPANP